MKASKVNQEIKISSADIHVGHWKMPAVRLISQLSDASHLYLQYARPTLSWLALRHMFFLFILGGQNNHDIIIKIWRSFFIFLKFHSKTIQIKFQRTVGPERKQINCCSWHSFVDISVVVVAVVPDRKRIFIKIKISASHHQY